MGDLGGKRRLEGHYGLGLGGSSLGFLGVIRFGPISQAKGWPRRVTREVSQQLNYFNSRRPELTMGFPKGFSLGL